jgi:hypothetical protein
VSRKPLKEFVFLFFLIFFMGDSSGASTLPNCKAFFGNFVLKKNKHMCRTSETINGRLYFGDWKNGKPHGQGKFVYPNGDTFEGQFVSSNRHGLGTYQFKDGRQYIGGWSRNKQHGKGVFNHPNGASFRGVWNSGTAVYESREKPSGEKYVGQFVESGKKITMEGQGTYTWPDGSNYKGGFKEDKRHGQGQMNYVDGRIEQGLWSHGLLADKEDDGSDRFTTLEERLKREALENQLLELKNQQESKQQQIDEDTQPPHMIVAIRQVEGARGTVSGTVTDNVEVAEVRVDGKLVMFKDGEFQWKGFVPPSGKDIRVLAIDMAGLQSEEVVHLKRQKTAEVKGPTFTKLDPTKGRRIKGNSNALALIVGIAKYRRTPADAIYADKDAQLFRDYVEYKLGVPKARIKMLVNEDAGEADILLSVKNWLGRMTKQGKSDIYVFFAGHGLASDDGEAMYLLPYDGRVQLLEDTAILRSRLFADLEASKPKSVTVFLDTCYSGMTRGTEMLVASRPIVLRAKPSSIPKDFTVFSAAGGNQTSKPLKETGHGMFSYFLMKGLEGEADANQDRKITVGELQVFVRENVLQQSSGSQTPELQGDTNRVLVRL